MIKKNIQKRLFIISVFIVLTAATAFAQGTSFNFQGRLNDGTNPANGQYDLQFRLFSAVTGGGQTGATISRPATILINGVFSVNLDFGATAFNNPSSVFLEIGVKPAGSPNAYTILGPRQQLTVVPFSVRANNATNADNAINAQNAVNATNAITATTANNALNFGGDNPNQYVRFNSPNAFNIGNVGINGNLSLSPLSSFGGNLDISGTAKQNLNSNGFVKAMLVVSNAGEITRCYNGIAATPGTNCGFAVTQPLTGVYRINFGFPITDRFFSVTARYGTPLNAAANNGANYREFDSTTMEVFTYNVVDSLDTNRVTFMIIMY